MHPYILALLLNAASKPCLWLEGLLLISQQISSWSVWFFFVPFDIWLTGVAADSVHAAENQHSPYALSRAFAPA